MHLRHGMNPHQPATVTPLDGSPITVLHGAPSYINLLDALNAWQLVRTASTTFARPAATSFKHVSPAGAALAGPLDEVQRATFGVDRLGPVASAYARARDADPKSSYGDFGAVSHPVDPELAELLRRLSCDGVIAPGYDESVVGTLSAKKRGGFLVLAVDPAYEPPAEEVRDVYGLRLTQHRDDLPLTRDLLDPALPDAAARDLLLGLIVLRYTQSNSIALVRDGMTIGIGAGQQSRIDCTRLAGAKADTWWLRRHPSVVPDPGLPLSARQAAHLAAVDRLCPADRTPWLAGLTDVAMVSDGAIPFADNIDEAARHGVRTLAEPGGSLRTPEVVAACAAHGITATQTGVRLFHH
ncbi:IMP cyclohydrolase [Kribbella flavida DSM 17836]|uniref:IMP cyclohydrolase n=1 Tax=Kribbella flavida (strain DSM 17836 / JCM 10339 / NBRC 14399) TaxID=479435 RepID=D2Q0V6_KRIFD|nr:5-aminoimidazole-4-carboxamide ribonucleotide formyltransferase [Kribbella flavida]ADB33906.1 IMP cyclohydrolase [Kribbella flavida DSM 17836]